MKEQSLFNTRRGHSRLLLALAISLLVNSPNVAWASCPSCTAGSFCVAETACTMCPPGKYEIYISNGCGKCRLTWILQLSLFRLLLYKHIVSTNKVLIWWLLLLWFDELRRLRDLSGGLCMPRYRCRPRGMPSRLLLCKWKHRPSKVCGWQILPQTWHRDDNHWHFELQLGRCDLRNTGATRLQVCVNIDFASQVRCWHLVESVNCRLCTLLRWKVLPSR